MNRDTYRSSNIVIQNSVINNGDGMFPLHFTFWVQSHKARKYTNETKRLRLLQTKQHRDPRPEPPLQRFPRYLRGLTGPIPRRSRHRAERPRLQHLHVQCLCTSPSKPPIFPKPFNPLTREKRTWPASRSGLVFPAQCPRISRVEAVSVASRTSPTTRCTSRTWTGRLRLRSAMDRRIRRCAMRIRYGFIFLFIYS